MLSVGNDPELVTVPASATIISSLPSVPFVVQHRVVRKAYARCTIDELRRALNGFFEVDCAVTPNKNARIQSQIQLFD